MFDAPRISASISIISSCVNSYLIRQSLAKLSTIYHRIMLGISSASLLASVAIGFSTVPMPADFSGYDSGRKVGNTDTCRAQGFFVTFKLYTMFAYNLRYVCTTLVWFPFKWKKRILYGLLSLFFIFSLSYLAFLLPSCLFLKIHIMQVDGTLGVTFHILSRIFLHTLC